MVGRLGIVLTVAACVLAGTASATTGVVAPTRAKVVAPAGGRADCSYLPQALETPGEGRPDPSRSLPSTGTLRVAMLFVTPNGLDPAESPETLYSQLAPPTEQWFRAASYGRLQLRFSPASTTWLPVTTTTIGGAIRAAGDLSGFDAVVAVLPAETRGFASHAEILGSGPVPFGVLLAPHPTATADRSPTLWWVLAHELSHTLGLPDLYASAGNGAEGLYAGPWDPMSMPLGQQPLAWHAWALGWLDPANVACVTSGSREATLTPVETAGGLKAVLAPQEDSVVVVEARRRTGLDAGLCDDGVLVYTVQLDAVPTAAPVRVSALDTSNGACGPLSNAALQPGDSIRVGRIRVDVFSGLRVRVSR